MKVKLPWELVSRCFPFILTREPYIPFNRRIPSFPVITSIVKCTGEEWSKPWKRKAMSILFPQKLQTATVWSRRTTRIKGTLHSRSLDASHKSSHIATAWSKRHVLCPLYLNAWIPVWVSGGAEQDHPGKEETQKFCVAHDLSQARDSLRPMKERLVLQTPRNILSYLSFQSFSEISGISVNLIKFEHWRGCKPLEKCSLAVRLSVGSLVSRQGKCSVSQSSTLIKLLTSDWR